ncbi:uncharacterized protein LOC103365832 isoform X1 [Stegastes partitus]|uniref:Uncharacterized protein LOC103365832 isoform X1 n=1 Tax=Stegastes partitus TaxID=144197 RepID=A0A9Y4KL77_9TELE|nr:PREDICTED: uncharacterized protein LOC103365832 isoform X1 [Stegastes partitus]
MVESRWNKVFLVLMLVLQFTGALSRQLSLDYTVREGDEATLSCENVINDQRNCDKTTWIFSDSKVQGSVELVDLGQIKNKIKSDRLSVTENCSLLIKKVTVEDVGRYTCRQFDNKPGGEQIGVDAVVYLSVVTLTEKKHTDIVTFSCSVTTRDRCRRTVKWLFKGRIVDRDSPFLHISRSSCSASVTILTYHFQKFTPYHQFFQCSVSRVTNTEQPLTFNLRPSGEDTKTATTTANNLEVGTNTRGPTIDNNTTKPHEPSGPDGTNLPVLLWLYIVLPLVLVALLIIAVKVIRSRRAKGKNTQGNDTVALTSNPAVTQPVPETSQAMADPEDGVSYASISYTKKADSKAKIRSKNDADDEAVTYSTVKASSIDSSVLYATINHPNAGP